MWCPQQSTFPSCLEIKIISWGSPKKQRYDRFQFNGPLLKQDMILNAYNGILQFLLLFLQVNAETWNCLIYWMWNSK